MKTSHVEIGTFNPDRDLGPNVRRAMNEVGMNDSKYVKIVQCGRAVVIMPDSDRTADAKPGEVMKMLGANDSLVKYVRSGYTSLDNDPILMDAPKSNPSRYDYTFRNDCNDQVSYVRITKEQIDLLEWLSNNDYLHYDMNWETGHEIPDIETI